MPTMLWLCPKAHCGRIVKFKAKKWRVLREMQRGIALRHFKEHKRR